MNGHVSRFFGDRSRHQSLKSVGMEWNGMG
jgi:hypothetical protein